MEDPLENNSIGNPRFDPSKMGEFLKELTALSDKYRFIIVGCGCCGSPYIMPKGEDGHYVFVQNNWEYLVYLTPSEKFWTPVFPSSSE